MNKRFFYEFFVGFVTLLAAYLFGIWGFLGFALLIPYPLIFRRSQPDERELLMLHQTATLTLSLMLMVLIVLYYISGRNFGEINIGKNWLQFAVVSFLIAHGAAGVYIFRQDKDEND
ncbi:MAG: hypothetical protein K9N06_06755 [Candidatus Cloacimonetes bacterium]|nr:hypothetical protein [Candidatus Cloacimonadota bacterium]